MKTLLSKVNYFDTSASINSNDIQEYANITNKSFDDAFNDLEQEIFEYDFVEEEKDRRLIFHKR